MSAALLPKAVLVAARLPGIDDAAFESSLDELARLVTTLGYQVVARITQARATLAPPAVIGEGKLQELAELTGGTGKVGSSAPRKSRFATEEDDAIESSMDDDDDFEGSGAAADASGHGGSDEAKDDRVTLVAVDHEISPSQLRNLERATGANVLDRTGVIIEIFHRHAHSREARLQVELARLKYESPRVRESPRGKERQRGRGAGDAALELDRRRIRDRIAELKEQLESVQREQDVRRAQRRSARRVALVGYTNAGKSSLMRALTASDVHVEDKLFATLDTTVRALAPEVKPRILVSDTVGFIRKLPHDLVASFKSTLDEALEASLILHVVDAADPSWESQLGVTREVLAEIGAGQVPTQLVMNKIDRSLPEALLELRHAVPEAWFVSARAAADVARVRDGILAFFEASYVDADFVVPYDRQRFVSEMHDAGRVIAESYEDSGISVRLRTDPETAESLRSRLKAPSDR